MAMCEKKRELYINDQVTRKIKEEKLQKMKAVADLGRIDTHKLGYAAFAGCLLIPLTLLSVFKPALLPLSIFSGLTSLPFPLKEEHGGNNSTIGKETIIWPSAIKETQGDNNSATGGVTSVTFTLKEEQGKNDSIVDKEPIRSANASPENQAMNNSTADLEMTKLPLDSKEEKGQPESAGIGVTKLSSPLDLRERPVKNKSKTDNRAAELAHVLDEKQKQNSSTAGTLIQESKLMCDFSEQRSDTCLVDGDVRIVGTSSTVTVASSQPHISQNITWKIRPYARKWEPPVMAYIKEITITSSADPQQTPHCTFNHSVPAIIFSTGGFLGNFFHDLTDVLIPLFITSRQYNTEVQFLATDFNPQWINKYQRILKRLSRYQVINMDTDDTVHCFPHVHVGLKSHKVLGIDPSKSPNGYSMTDFRELLRTSFSLKREATRKINKQSTKKPRILIMLRKGSRSFTNEKAVIAMTRRLGYKVVTAGPEETKNLSHFAQIVNSCDVMIGVHGAGLANMVFLPTNATLIQIIPWGGLKWACRHDYGEPAPDMGIKYLEYEIREEESSLIERYPRDHAVFKDPLSIQKQGWHVLWSIFLDKQKVKLDIGRFRGVLLEVFQSLKP